MSTYVVIKEYPDGHRQYRLLQATPRELERVRHDWTRIIPMPHGWQSDVGDRSMECDYSRPELRSYTNEGLLDGDS
jgi:hypothetical protein